MNRDFAACGGFHCPIKSQCRRFALGLELIRENTGMGYWVMAMYDKEKKECRNFITRKEGTE